MFVCNVALCGVFVHNVLMSNTPWCVCNVVLECVCVCVCVCDVLMVSAVWCVLYDVLMINTEWCVCV